MMILLLLFFCPLITSAKITISVNITSNKSDIKFNYTGNDYKIVTNTELNIFNVTKENLNRGMRVELGKVPDDVFLKDPTYCGDIFKKFKWGPVKRSLKVNKIKIIDILNEDVLLKTHEHINNSTTSLKSKRCLYTVVENTAQSSWFTDGIPHDDILYNLNLNFSYGILKYENKWRNNSLHHSKMLIGVTRGGIILIKPRQTVITKLIATKTILLIELEYKAMLVGSAVANYVTRYGKHHFWAPSIQDVMKAAVMRNEVITKEQIEVRCFLNPRLNVYDKMTGEIIEPPENKRPLMKIMRNKNMTRIVYTRIKKKPQKNNK